MNLGAGQPASLPYGVEPPSWYSNQYPYHSVQFSSPPIAYPRQAEPDLHPCSIPLQIDSEVPITDSKHCEFNFSDAKVSEFLESVSRLWDACMSKCMKGIQSSEGSSPSLLDDVPPPTHTPKIQSSEPKICSPMRPQPTSKPSHLGDTQSLSVANISMSRTKQASSKSIPATGGVKKCKFLQRNKLLMRKLAFKTNLRVQSSVAPPLLDDVVSAISNNTHASFCSGPNLGENGRECDALHLLDEMSKSKELCNAGKMSVGYMGIRDKGGGLATHCAIVYEYFQLPDKKTTAHLDYKPSVVSRNFGLKDKTARALAPSEALTGVHGFMEFGNCKLDYFGKGVLAVAGNVNDIIGPALIENDPVEQILVDNYMVQQLERFRNEWGWCKQELGENAISAVSLYVRKAGANLAGNKTLILHVPTKSDGSSITLLTKDICNNVWVSSGALKLVQSEFRTAFVLVMNKPTDIVDDNYENIQAHSKRVLELLLKKWKSRVIAKTQSQARLVQWFILSLQLCHCKRKVPTLACTLNACSNGNMLCLRLEINLEKMSLCLAEKWEKRDRIVKQMFDGNWERWKFIVIAIKNESGTEELHVESLLAVLGVWERIFSRREDKEATIVDQNYSCASCFQERDCFVVLKLVLLPLLKPLQLQSWPTTEDKLKQGGISDKFCEGLKLLWLLFFSDVMSILLLFNKGVIASGMSTKILCECLESLFDVLDKFGNVMATYHKLSLGALLSQWSSNQVIMRKKTKSCAASLASRLSDDLLAKAAIEVVQHFSNSDSSSFTSSPDGFGVCFEDFNAELWFLSLLATMQSTVQFPKYSKIIWSLDTLAYSNGSNFASSIVRDQGVGVAILMNSKTILVAFFGKVIPGSSYVLLLALVDGIVRLWVLERDHAFVGWHSTKDIKHDSYSMILSVLAKYVESLNSTSIAASSYVCGKLISKAARWDMIADEVSHPEVLLVIGKYKSRMDGICGEHGFLHDKKWGGIVTEHGSLLRCLNLYKLHSWEANGTCKEIMQGDYGTLKFRFEIINLLTVKFITYVTIVADSCIAESAENPHIKEVISIAFELQFELIIISAEVGYEFSKLFLESAYSEMRGTGQVIRDVTKDLKTENTDALCKDSQGLSLPPSATDSYFYGKLNAKGESSEVIFISLGMEEEAFEQDFKNMDLIICDCLYVLFET